ncbi:MAG: HAMP domain-containing histidine kinase [Alphaproteobacteria bacterium]|nr:HAMP domain-containing histidine kinase [Alphaproteobacteria bacterium]
MRLPRLLNTASFRLASAYILLFTASVGALGAIVYFRTTEQFQREAQTRIEAEGQALQLEYREGGLSDVLSTLQSRRRSKLSGGLDYVLYDASGKTYLGSLATLPYKAGWTTVLGPPDGDEPAGQLEELTVLVLPLSDTLWLAIGDDLIRISAFGDAILRTFLWVMALSAAFAVGGGMVLSHLFLRRVGTITATAEAIIGGDIRSRVPRRRADDEFDRLAATLNRMLDRIAALMEALHDVSSSIAHELRTPLAHLKQTLETMRVRAGDGDVGADVDQAIGEADAVLATFSALLRIAQIESGMRKQAFRPIGLSDLVASLAETFRPVAEDEGQELIADVDAGVEVPGDRELLTQMIVNVLENALRHGAGGTSLAVSLKGGPAPVLSIADRGRGIPSGERRLVFQRFYRVDAAPGAAGSGLGLSIVAAVAELHGIGVALEDNAPGLRVVFRFPDRAPRSLPRPAGALPRKVVPVA